MPKNEQKIFNTGKNYLKKIISKHTLRNALFFSGGIILFIFGVLAYGVVLNLRDVPLKEAMLAKGFKTLSDVNIIIERKTFTLSLYEDTVLIKNYRTNFGKNLGEPKSLANDGATPVGEYKICSIDTSGKYHKNLIINYPNLHDASEAMRKGLITQQIFDKLKFEFYYSGCTDSSTVLGGNIGIHGIGEYNFIFKNLPFVYNWTDGSIAVSNEAIDEIYSVIKKGTKVVIK